MKKSYIMTPKVLTLILAMILVSTGLMAQKNEVGGGLGTIFYTGDLGRGLKFSSMGPAATVLYRTNLNDYMSLRVSFLGGNLKGNDAIKPVDAFAVARDASFNIFISEFAGTWEYYFLNFRGKRSNVNWSPYFHAGVSVFGMLGHENKNATYSNVQIAIPFGFGFRYQLDKRWGFGIEYGVRATFFDYLDNISDGDIYDKNYQYGNIFDTDQYHFLGLTVSYTFYKVICPTLPLKQGYRKY